MTEDDTGFDRVMELVGENGKFQRVYNHFYNVALVCFASMSYMNCVLVLNEPDHTCHVPGRENYNLTINEWYNLTIPTEKDNRGALSRSGCKMYNTSLFADLPIDQWNFTESDNISCVHGYDYDKTWYERTVVSDQDWICDKSLYQTNVFVWHRVGEVVGTFFFGQLGDTIGRRPVFYLSAGIIIVGRIMSAVTASVYYLYAIASLVSMLTSMQIFLSPLIIAMEVSREEDRGKIAMFQCIGWTLGLSIMPLVFWAVRDWVWFLMITTLPIGLFALWDKYMIESPRWLATKGRYDKCATQLNRIAKINGKDVKLTEKMLRDLMPEEASEDVYGIFSLFAHWRLAKNTIMLIICWSNASITYFVLMLNSTRMGGNPFLSFLYQSAIEFPSFVIGRYLGDRIGRRYCNALAMFCIFLTCIPVALVVRDPNSEFLVTCLVIFIKFATSIIFFAINLQSMEVYPTCLRQSGIAAGAIASNTVSTLGPYIVYLGTEYDVRYPYYLIGVLGFVGFIAAMLLPETLHHKLPNTMHEAKKFGKDQKFWFLPRKQVEPEEEIESLQKIDERYDNRNTKT
ncbi:Carcinine transporter [Pseudolycoriella hygida]|uniref:Carcinine transporter n=1 Tax=Pseudolycoriella hygida TaxID=35572 RepID=A0A9Q0N0S3_9DIPT|nr:Carcinine transporter [Pseudolycoriella hygida]